MAKYEITSPSGKKYQIEAPDGATKEQALEYGRKQLQEMQGPSFNDRMLYGPTNGMSGPEKIAAGAGKAVSDLGLGVQQRLGIADQAQVDESKKLDAPLMGTAGGKAGNLLGNVAMVAPTAAIPGANTLTGSAVLGAALGAAQPTATGESVAGNSALGGAGGFIGQSGATMLGRALRPVRAQLSPELQGLAGKAAQFGIDLTPAQATGSKPLKIIDSVMENLPFTADRQAAIKQAQRGQFNSAVLKTIGEDSKVASPDVLNNAKTRIGGEFERLTKNKSIPIGDDFLNALTKIDSDTTAFSNPQIKSAVDKGLELASSGKISGEEYQKVRTVLGKASSDAFKGNNSELGQALKSIKSALDDAADKSISTDDKDAWNLARKQWQSLKVVEKAAAPTSADAVSGNVSAAKLAQALMSVDKKGFTYGTSNKEMGDLARIGQAFVKDQVPDSGTAQRSFWQGALENPLRLIPGAAGFGSIPAQALINSSAGKNYLMKGVGPKTPEALAELLRRGSTATGASLPLTYLEQ